MFLRASVPAFLFLAFTVTPARPEAPPQLAAFDVDTRGAVPEAPRDPRVQERLGRTEAWRAFAARTGDWVVRWDERREVPLRATGPGATLGAVPADIASARGLAAGFLTRETRAWTSGDELRVVRAAEDGGGWWIHHAQLHRGLRVVGSRVSVRVTRAGTLPSLTLDVFPGLDVDPAPAVGEAAAQRAAIAGLPPDAGLDLLRRELVVLPLPGPRKPRGVLTYEFELRASSPPNAWRAYVDAGSGELLWRYTTVRTADLGGTIRAEVEPLQVQDTQQIRALWYAGLRLVNAEGDTVASAVTDPSGIYALTAEATGPHTLRVPLGGPFGVIHNHSLGDSTPVVQLPVDLGADPAVSFTFQDGNSLVQDRDAYYWTMQAHDHIRRIEPGFDLLDYPMPITTDIAGFECNAFWDGLGINFYPAGPNCTNTARSASVVIHEYGHGITDFQYRPFAPSGAMHEGFSDYYSATLLGDPAIGHGFFGRGTQIRTIDNTLRAPQDLTGESHQDGLIIAAALWDAREALGQVLADSLWHYARYGYSDTFDDYLLDYLLVDDDDGNIYNGTPHFGTIIDAFRAHGIGDYGVHIGHEPLPDTEDLDKTFPLTAVVLSLFGLEESTVTVHLVFDRGGSFSAEDRVLTPTGGIREFTTLLASQPADTEVQYWFTAADTTGAAGRYPAGSGAFSFRVGADLTPPVITHDVLGDQPLGGDAIRIIAAVEDNLDRPVGLPRLVHRRNAGEDAVVDFTPLPGGHFEALIPDDALVLGDAFSYRIEVEDGAASPNLGVYPDPDAVFHIVRGEGRDLEADDGGLAGSGSWAWGVPTFARAAYSGERAWATVLDGVYENDVRDSLVWGPFDLSTYTKAGLFLRTTYDIEPFWDGGTVFASRNQGGAWEVIRPDGDYPAPRIYGNPQIAQQARPGYSGANPAWEPAAFDLSAFLGEPDVRIKFEFVSDGGVVGPGWFVDDVQLMERQVFARPGAVTSRSGRDGRVPLTWSPPPGVPLEGPHAPIRGYAVYRSQGAGPWTRLNPEPVAGLSYQDETVVNGVTYAYSVAAVYDDGESARSEPTEALPYLAAFAAMPEEITAQADPGRDTTVTLAVTNPGTGFLHANAWRALPGMHLDDVRIRYALPSSFLVDAPAPPPPPGREEAAAADGLRAAVGSFLAAWGRPAAPGGGFPAARGKHAEGGVREPPSAIPPPGTYTVLFEDPLDHGSQVVPDFKTFEAQTGGSSVYFRITTHRNWGNPITGFNLFVALDTDDDIGTGANGDVLLIAGALAYAQFQTPAVLVDGTSYLFLNAPHHVILNPNTNVAEFGFFLSTLGNPEDVVVLCGALNTNASTVFDYMPDVVPAFWLQFPEPSAVVFQGTSGSIPVKMAAGSLAEDRYEGLVLLDTNTPQREYAVPVVFHVGEPEPVTLAAFTAEPGDLGVTLRWRTADETSHAGFHVYRDAAPPGGEVRLTGALIPPAAGGAYAFVDDTVEPGREYLYRLADVARDGTVTSHGPLLVRFAGASGLTRPVLRQSAPNPLVSGTVIRLGLPAATRVRLGVYSVTGRLVRALADAEYPSGFHEIAWDGRDGTGRPVAAGVYTVLMESPLGGDRGKLVVSR